jgi:hypothetical protein
MKTQQKHNFGASKSHKQDHDNQKQTHGLLTISHTFYRTLCGRDRETITNIRRGDEKLEHFDPTGQEAYTFTTKETTR